MSGKRKMIYGGIIALLIIVIVIMIFLIFGKKHVFYCDKYMLTVDDKQYDLLELEPEMSSVSELLLIDRNHLFIMGRIDAERNALMIYDFKNDEFIFNQQGTALCFTDTNYKSSRYLVDDIVFDLDGNIIYKAPEGCHVYIIEYVEKDLKITISDMNYENLKEVWL